MAKRRKPAKGSGQLTLPIILSVLLFFVICFNYSDTVKVLAMVLMVATLIIGAIRFSVLRGTIKPTLVLLIAVTVMGGISAFYALANKFALKESLTLIVSLCSSLLLLAAFPQEDVSRGRKIATVLEFAAAIGSFFSIDLISTRIFSNPLLSFLGQYTGVYRNLPGVERGVRMLSIFNTPNIFAGCAGIGVLLALALVLSSERRKERNTHLCCLYVNAVAFVLAFSMGATAIIALAFVVYIIIERQDRRGDLLVLMIKTLIIALLAVALTAATSFDKWDGIQPIPLLSLIIGAVLLCLADMHVLPNLGKKLRDHSKILLIVVAAIIILGAGFAVVAYNVTGSVELPAGVSLHRSAYPEPGDYTISAVGGEGVRVTVSTQNRQETMMHTETVLYNGDLSSAAFTVPEDSLVVKFTFRSKQSDVTIHSAEYVGSAGSGKIPLGYPLLPDFIANRLQGLFANQNAIQRTVFFEDGMKLFKLSPIFGLGIGAFENASQYVQDFYYQTKYVHNHYIQTLLETGIIGFILFVGLLVFSAIAVIRSRKKEDFHPLVPALGALLVFMAGHAAVEVVFSAYAYLPLAFGVFTLINICCDEPITLPLGKKLLGGIGIAVGAFLLIFTVALSGTLLAKHTTEVNRDFPSFRKAAAIDRFEWADYALTYVLSASKAGEDADPEILAQAEKFVTRLDKKEISNIIYLYLSEYCFNLGDTERAMEMAAKHARCIAPNSEAWNALFTLLSGFAEDTDEFRAGVQKLVDFKESWNSEHIGTIVFSEESQTFIDQVLGK